MTYYPSDLESYEVQQSRFISGNFSFFEVVSEDDAVGLYKKKVAGYSQYGSVIQIDFFYKRKSDTALLRVPRIGFKKTFMRFFQDCPELQKKVEKREFKYKSLEQMFGFYRSVCHKVDEAAF